PAALATTTLPNTTLFRSAGTVSTGGLITSRTTTVKLLVALRGGAPLSVTRTVIKLVLGPCASVGVQLSTPVLASRRTPVGAETRGRLSAWVGWWVCWAWF